MFILAKLACLTSADRRGSRLASAGWYRERSGLRWGQRLIDNRRWVSDRPCIGWAPTLDRQADYDVKQPLYTPFVPPPPLVETSVDRAPAPTVMTLFGTRPEAIKLAPVLQQLEALSLQVRTINVTSAQHTDLLYPFIQFFNLRVDYDLHVLRACQTPQSVCLRVVSGLGPILQREQPAVLLVQGDTTTALAGALAAHHRGIAVAHVEAGLRSGDVASPYPEEVNRRWITRLADYHFAATIHNCETLQSEGVPADRIVVTGNPVVDALRTVLEQGAVSAPGPEGPDEVTAPPTGVKRLVLTTHRRESFGAWMEAQMRVLRAFVARHPDVELVFPVHPNPAVRLPAQALLAGRERIRLLAPLPYFDFIRLLRSAWLIVTDSGGIQEEAPTLGKPVLVLRDTTERPEALAAGVARLTGRDPQRLEAMLEDVYGAGDWREGPEGFVAGANPFGDGRAGQRIVQALAGWLHETAPRRGGRR